MRITSICLLLGILTLVAPASADDWPQWLGPNRDSVWREKGIVKAFPENGLTVKWRAPVALGYSGPAIAGGKVYVMDYVLRSGKVKNNPGGRDKLEGTERVLCLAADTGKLLWKHEYDRPYNFSYGGGPRCTPTVEGGKVYALGAEGNLTCLDAGSGKVLWSKDFVKDYGAKTPMWGVAAHPLVEGDTVYCLVGGKGSMAVAFDKTTGRELWRALSASGQGYCPPTMIEHAGTKQLLIWHNEAVNSLNPKTGKVYWSIPLKARHGMSIAAPRLLGSSLFVSGYSAVLMLQLDDAKPAAEIVWRGAAKTAIHSANATPFLEDGTIYGCDLNSGALMGVDMKDAARLWQTVVPTMGAKGRGRYGTAFIVKHEDRFFLLSETGDLILAKLSPKGYEEKGRFHVIEPTTTSMGRRVVWSQPAFAEKCLFTRNDKELVCVSLADK